jgi:hypothetical protein
MAAQDQEINKISFKNKILRKEIESRCLLCEKHEETIFQVTSGCSIFGEE